MAVKMGESFDAIAMAAKAPKATYEDQAHTISTRTATNVELAATIKNLTNKIVTLSEKLGAAAKPSGQRDGAPPWFDSDSSNTGSAANSDEVFMSTRKNKKRWELFLSKQKCGHCEKPVNHLPDFCSENPKRKMTLLEATLAKAKADTDK